MRRYLGGINRTLCDVLDAMRKCYETHNYGPLLALIEEAQIHGNAMEAALYDQKNLKEHKEELKDLKEQLRELEAEIKSKEKLRGLI